MFHKPKLATPNVASGWKESKDWASWEPPLNAVHGASHRQDALWSICGSQGLKRGGYTTFADVLIAREPNNPVDRSALRVTVDDLHVGYVAREIAEQLSPGLDKAKVRDFTVPGVVRGGSPEAPSLGIHLWLSRRITSGPEISIADDVARSERFRVAWRPVTDSSTKGNEPSGDDVPGVYTGGSQHGGRSSEIEVSDREVAIRRLREFLMTETDSLERHFAFNNLEESLYKVRDRAATLLSEYRDACEQHHSEIDVIRAALITKFGGLPFIPMYKQMPILLTKQQEWPLTIEWCERGIQVYGQDCLERQWPEDLAKWMAKLRTRMAR